MHRKRETIPSGSIIWERYQEFMGDLPQLAQEYQLKIEELIFNDYYFGDYEMVED